MDRYRSMYKENPSMLTPAQHNRTNRELQNANRAKSRRQIFQSSRNFDVSPTPRKGQNPYEIKEIKRENGDKENSEAIGNDLEGSEAPKLFQNEANKSRIALGATSKVNAKKATKQELYLLKFIEWKEAHKQKEQKKNDTKRRPFVASGGAGGNAFGSNTTRMPAAANNGKNKKLSTFVPKGHTQFRPPAGLKDPVAEMTTAAKDLHGHDRKSFYTVVPTPPRKKQDVKKAASTKTPCVSSLARTNSTQTPAVGTFKPKPTTIQSTRTAIKTGAIPKTGTKPTAVVEPTKNTAVGRALTYPVTTAMTTTNTPACDVQQSSTKVALKNGVTMAKATVNRLNIAQKFARPQPPKKVSATILTRQPVAQQKNVGASATARNTQKPAATRITTGAAGKAHLLQNKLAAASSANNNQPQRHTKFATSFKAKKTQVSTFNRPNAPGKITIKGKTLLGGGGRVKCKTDAAFAIAETPTDLLNINPYEPFVTSTRVKTLSPHTTNTPNISPINREADGICTTQQQSKGHVRTTHVSTSAKRTLLTNEDKPSAKDKPNLLQKQKTKFNFIRYSVGVSELDTSGEGEKNGVDIEENVRKEEDAQHVTVLEVKPKAAKDNSAMPPLSATNGESALDKTPTPKETERPVNYVGSFVSVSRGKVSARKERERRDSIYVPSSDTTLIATASVTPLKVSKEAFECQPTVVTPLLSVEARRMLEAVRYFRQQLNSEIERLHALCDQWDEYKVQNVTLLQQSGGEDMINATIGQARLLTSKKFQQFRGLIERCESGARGTAAASDGSEDTKPVTDVDLEGFWSILNLQVDNIEKRFEKLTSWKSNNWSDPEDVLENNKQTKAKVKPNLTKVKKAKAPPKAAKASSGLQAMLRKMHAEMRKKKETAIPTDDTDVAVILTPSSKQQHQRRSQSGTPKIECTNTETQRNSTPRHYSVVVRDRKSLSCAATIISLPADDAMATAVAAQRRRSRLAASSSESPKSLKSGVYDLRHSLSNMEKTLSQCNDLRRTALAGNANKARRLSGTPNFIESPLDTEGKQQPPKQQMPTTPPPTPAASRKSILKTPGTAKGKPKSVIFNEKMRVKKFKFTMEDGDELSNEEEELRMRTSTEDLLGDQRTYSLRTRKVVLRPSSEFEIPS